MITTDSLGKKYESVPEHEKREPGLTIVEETTSGAIVHEKGTEPRFYHSPQQAKEHAGRQGRRFYYLKFGEPFPLPEETSINVCPECGRAMP